MTFTRLILISLIASHGAVAQAADGPWRGYVCKATDWHLCLKGKKRIYPEDATYSDREACLKDFGILFEDDPAMREKYPQTDDIKESYVYDCEDTNNPAGDKQA